EHAKLERQLRQAQKMEAISTLAGGIAHDFNNLLGGIMGFAELGLHECRDPALSAQNFRQILLAGQRASALTRQILAFSRQSEQARTPMNLEHAVTEALKLLRAAVPSSIEFRTFFDAETPNVLADATQIRQI